MNNTITLSQLITGLASATGVDNNTARRFLRILFSTIEDSLAAGHSVTIKGVGTFKPIADEMQGKGISVAFTPDKEIAGELNRPFEMFTAVELADGVDFTECEDENNVTANDSEPTTDATEDITEAPLQDDIIEEHKLYWPEEEENITVDESEPSAAPEPVETPNESQNLRWPEEDEETTEPEQTEPEESEEEQIPQDSLKKHNLLWVWIALILVAVIAVAYLAAVYTTPIGHREAEEQQVDAPDTTVVIEEVAVEDIAAVAPQENAEPTAPEAIDEPKTEVASDNSKEPVYDIVEVSLIRLAKKHYGESSYWVYIYEANSDIISNPNRIRPGQKVLIPDKSTFPGSSRSETVSIAKRKQTELLNRFK